MKIALAWLDRRDPTDRAVADGLGKELERLGHRVRIIAPCSSRELSALQSRERFDVWHGHVVARDHAPLVRAVENGKWPLVLTVHTIVDECSERMGGRAAVRRLLRAADRVVVPSSGARADISTSASVIAHGVAPGGLVGKVPRSPRPPYILSVGRLAPYKGQDLLLMAFAKAKARLPGVRLALCGPDLQKGELKRFAARLGVARDVAFLGRRRPSEVRALLRGCEFFVLPSRRETFSLATLEAMASGKAVLASKTGAVPELIRDGRDGLVVAPGNVGALAAALARLHEQPGLRRRLGASAGRRARRYTWRRAAKAYAALYHDVAFRREF